MYPELIFFNSQPWIFSLNCLELSPLCFNQEMTETLCHMTMFLDYYMQILFFLKHKVEGSIKYKAAQVVLICKIVS